MTRSRQRCRRGDDRFRTFVEAYNTVSPTKFTNVLLKRGDIVRYTFDHTGLFVKDNGNGTITYTPESAFEGADQSRYRITDPAVFELCEHVCGGLRRRIEELDGLIPGGIE